MRKVKKATILGASLGGLSTGISLLEKGVEVLLIDASSSPTLKTCGEFLSHEAVSLLNKWGIRPKREIKEAFFYYQGRKIVIPFPDACGSTPRLALENALLERFIALGGKASLGTKVHHIIPGPPFQLHMDAGEVVETFDLIISTGRFQGKAPTTSPHYIGIKNHYQTPYPPSALHMTFIEGGYYGISPLDHKTMVVSCLLKKREPVALEELFSKNPLIQEHLRGATPFLSTPLVTPLGNFGKKELPLWEGSYFVGDAAATVAPLIGQGMTIALTSGQLAANYVRRGEWQEYRKAWKKHFSTRVSLSSILNSLALSPLFAPRLFPLLEKYPKIIETLLKKSSSTRQEEYAHS